MSCNEWKEVKLGELGDIITGKTPPTKVKENFGDKYLFLTPTDMDERKFITTTNRKLSEQGVELLSNQLLKNISVCVSCIGSDMGKVVMINEPTVTNQQINSITNIETNYYPDFIYYSLLPMKEYLHRIAGGSTMPIVNKTKFSEIEIMIPSYQEQKKIADFLSTLDDKIELNNQINETLEEMAQAIFKHWFVDYEFPNENGEPYKSSGGKLVESELGMIPKGWKTLDYLSEVDVLSGGTPKTTEETFWDGDIPLYTPRDYSDNAYTLKTEKSITELGLENCNSDLYSSDTIFITARGTVGNVCMNAFPMAINQSCYALKVKKESIKSQYFLYLLTKRITNNLQKYATGSVFNSITVSTFKSIKVSVPEDENILKHANAIFESLFKKIRYNAIQTEEIINMRDTLLPKLMSGEIRIPDAEKEVEACLQKNS